ncbi:MAG: thioether cross-link-forming SCIFF peptide maturase [Lachnospiraceae bacterium]|nr:thioether cross-link-forming SCIFF peptide maturase [Lachnospiraceae bacterium]
MIHQYKLNGYNIILDTYSGSIHTTDELCYDLISMVRDEVNARIQAAGAADASQEKPLESACAAQVLQDEQVRRDLTERLLAKYGSQAGEADIAECFDDVLELVRSGKLFTDDVYRDKAYDLKERSTVIKALCLHVAHTCNLNCEYCFASQGNFQGTSGLMSFEVGKRALDFLVENSGFRRNLEVDFFGGEPLMNFEVCKQLVAYARSIEKEKKKNFRFTLTTNGVGVTDEVIEWANRECHNVVLSLDGRKEVNDRFRVDKQGRGSYDVIVPKFQKFVKARGGKGYYMRGTYTHFNTDFTKDIFHMADDLGFTELSMEPVVTSPDSPSALREEDKETLYEQYEILAKDMLRREKEGKPITFYHYMLDLSHGPCIYKRISGCGSGTEYLAVTPWGDLYPCHQFVNDPAYKLGDIWNGIVNTELRDRFKLCNVYARSECEDCWAKLYCSGGCAANALHASGDILGTYEYGCDVFRKRIECAIMMKAAQAAGDTAPASPEEARV